MQQKVREHTFQPPPQGGRRGWWGWTGFGKKTLWDWLQLLVVPAMLAIVGFLLAAAQENIQQQAEGQRAQAQQDAEEQRSQDTALQSYIDQMSQLLIDEGLRDSEPGDEVRTSARARTLTVLSGLDAQRKARVVRFLYETDLITKGPSTFPGTARRGALGSTSSGIVSLVGADLSGGLDLTDVPKFSEADLSGANLDGLDVSNRRYPGANLDNVVMSNAELHNANLRGAYMRGAKMLAAKLIDADLSGAHLSEADLRGANLSGANLSGADLSDASLEYAALSGTDLTDATVTQEQLDPARSLEGATMPDGSVHD